MLLKYKDIKEKKEKDAGAAAHTHSSSDLEGYDRKITSPREAWKCDIIGHLKSEKEQFIKKTQYKHICTIFEWKRKHFSPSNY